MPASKYRRFVPARQEPPPDLGENGSGDGKPFAAANTTETRLVTHRFRSFLAAGTPWVRDLLWHVYCRLDKKLLEIQSPRTSPHRPHRLDPVSRDQFSYNRAELLGWLVCCKVEVCNAHDNVPPGQDAGKGWNGACRSEG